MSPLANEKSDSVTVRPAPGRYWLRPLAGLAALVTTACEDGRVILPTADVVSADAGERALDGGLGEREPAEGWSSTDSAAPAPQARARSCEPPIGACSAPTVRVTEINLSQPVVTPRRADSDLEPLPFAISPILSGGSRLAWMGTDERVYLAELDCDDQMTAPPVSFPAHDFQDLYADDEGGVLLVTRAAEGEGAAHCGAGPLCGAPKPDACFDMYLVRFDRAGHELWSTKLTRTAADREPYDAGARFVWEAYQHHGRIAHNGSDFAAYFCIGITVQNNSCVDIHEGDRMQVVNPAGALVENHPDAFEVGCSHSWTPRMVWDPRSARFVTVCATDNNCRLARSGSQTIVHATCDGHFFGGDVVLAPDTGFWTSYSSGGTIRLAHFVTAAADRELGDVGGGDFSHLVAYGQDRMIVAWGAGPALKAQVRDAVTGATLGSFDIDVPDHPFQAFRAFPDGSAAFPAQGASSGTVRIARVMPCAP